MREIGARVRGAGRALAPRIERREISRERSVEDIEFAAVCHRAPVAAASSRIDAVEEIDPGIDRLQQIARRSDAHEIPRLLFGQKFGSEAGAGVQLVARFTYR